MGRGTLWTTAMLGGTPRKLSDHLANGARWSPDGRSVVFFDLRTLYRIDADGENLTKDLGGADRSERSRLLARWPATERDPR